MTKIHYHLYRLMPFLDRRASLVLSLPASPVIADLGCNIGANLDAFRLLRNDLIIHGFDREDFSTSIQGKGCIFHQVDLLMDKLPLADSTVDLVIASHIIEHLPNTDNLVAEARRILKPDGMLFIEAPGIRSLFFPSLCFSDKKNNYTCNFYDDPTHLRPYSAVGLYRLAVSSGYRVKKYGISRNWLFTLSSPLLIVGGIFNKHWLLTGLTNLIGWSVFLVAQPEK